MQIPEGYMRDAQGALVPRDKIKPQHLLEDQMVQDLGRSALQLSEALSIFKESALGKASDFRDLLAQEYDTARGGRKGNLTFRSFDGSVEMQVAVSDQISFGPELQNAKDLIDECILEWSEGANANIRALIDQAFQVNKVGRIDTHRVLGLRRLDIKDAKWARAMDAISDAVRVHSSRTYLRFYQVDPETGARHPIPLDLAAL